MSGHACIQAALFASMLMASALAAPQNDLSSEFGSQPICGCGKRLAKRGRVVGGDELELNSAPWLATLARGRKSHCGAALISGVHILTAAHCIDGAPLSDLKAWLGVHSLAAAGLVMSARSLFRGNLLEDQDDEGEGVGRSIKMAWPHPQFDSSTFRNDIAVLELSYPVKFSSRLYPICLPSNDREQYDQRIALVAGWGRTGEQLPPSDVPRQAMIEVWSNDQCQNSGLPRARLRGAILCAGRISGGLDACQGDSGGPLVLSGSNGEMEVIGVVSWGRGCARPNLPGVYTRVASYLPFIRNAMSNSCPT